MTDSGDAVPWLVIREDGNGNRYRVGSYATRAEAERAAAQLDNAGSEQPYVVEQVGRHS